VFERFTKDARAVVIGAYEVCRARGDDEIGPVHVLLALTATDSPMRGVLAQHGLEAASVDEALRAESNPGMGPRRGLDDDDAEALRAVGIDLDAIRAAVEASFGEGALDGPVSIPSGVDDDELGLAGARGRGRFRFGGGHLPFTGGAKKSLELALREAIRSRSGEIRAEHLALGVLRADDLAVTRVLWHLNVDSRALRTDLEDLLRRSA